MDNKLKFVNIDLSELNFKLGSLFEILKIKEINNYNELKKLSEILLAYKNDNTVLPENKKQINEISEIISTLKYDLSELKKSLITSDSELKRNINAYNLLLQYDNLSYREREELQNKIEKYSNALNKYELKVSSGYGYKGRLNINNKPYDSVAIGYKQSYELETIDGMQKNLVSSLKAGFNSAGMVLSSAIAQSILPLNKVNSLAERLLHTFTEAATKALLIKTIFSGFDIMFNNGFNIFRGNNALNITDIIPMPATPINNIYGNKNIEIIKHGLNYNTTKDITLNIPKVEFVQKGYDLQAVIKKVTTTNNKYL
ncbi:MAG TPA: hypothetical protein PL041_13515 [Melioribacteraceae bacterium]|nr:hypothetical protein [Melioribacteraceae bacterium]